MQYHFPTRPVAIPFGDGSFKRDTLEAGHMERHVFRGGDKVPVAVAAAAALTGFAVLLCQTA